jgi:uncharacterized membrane protein
MLYEALKALHVLSIIVWIGGMVFAHFFLRPAVAELEAPVRLKLMRDVLGRFFQSVLVVSLLTLISGIWMLGRVAKQTVQSGGGFNMPVSWMVMAVLGVLMVVIFFHIRFALYTKLKRFVQAEDWAPAGEALAQVRQWVFFNLIIGVLILLLVLG